MPRQEHNNTAFNPLVTVYSITERQTDYSIVKIADHTVRRDVKSSWPKWPRGQNFGLGLGLSLKALASASSIWPQPGLGLQQNNQQSRRDGPVCLPNTGHHTMIHVESSY